MRACSKRNASGLVDGFLGEVSYEKWHVDMPVITIMQRACNAVAAGEGFVRQVARRAQGTDCGIELLKVSIRPQSYDATRS
jgi:hypothetical protein